MIKFLFIFSLIIAGFSDFAGLRFLGEMQRNLSCHTMTLAMILFFFSTYANWFHKKRFTYNTHGVRLDEADQLLRNILLTYYAVIVASLIANFTAIMATYGNERYGIGKFFASTIMITYGFAFSFFTINMAKKYPWHDIIIRPLAIGFLVATFFGIMELMSQHFGGVMKDIQLLISQITHSASRETISCRGGSGACGTFGWFDDTIGRIRSVSFEPPAFADYVGVTWGWIYGGYIASSGRRRLRYAVVCWIGLLLLYFSGARTGYIFLALSLFISFVLRYIYLSEKKYAEKLAYLTSFGLKFMFCLAFFIYVYTYNQVTEMAVSGYDWHDGRSISTLTRLSMTTAGWYIFSDNLILGIGFGQYGFAVEKYLPDWAWQSWEIKQWFRQTPGGIWPSSFSTYVRFGSEMGILGLLLWAGTWFLLARSVLKLTIEYKKLTGIILLRSYPLIMGCYAVLLRGVASDALNLILIWINLGLCCLFIKEVKYRIAQMHITKDYSGKVEEIKNGKVSAFYFY